MPDTESAQVAIDTKYVIEDKEELLRLLSFPSCLNAKGQLTTEAFSLYHKDEDYVSLSRLLYCTKEEAIASGGKIKVWPSKNDKFSGLAQLNAKEIIDISSQLLLASKYSEKNKAHAGISFVDDKGDIFVNTPKGKPVPAWILPLQQELCYISKVETI